MKRIAKCHCGELSVETEGEPANVIMCHCEFCQRRTGTSYHLAAWFPSQDVTIRGELKTYVRTGDRGDKVEFSFCPNCGSNVFLELQESMPDKVGVAVGCFVEPEFPAPNLSVFGRTRHKWLPMPEGTRSLTGGIGSDPE
ncbi:MAG: hypothetical protein ACI915_003683 [Gammaproteobacteria bacterium]